MCNFQSHFSYWWLKHFLVNCLHCINECGRMAELQWWLINISSGYGLIGTWWYQSITWTNVDLDVYCHMVSKYQYQLMIQTLRENFHRWVRNFFSCVSCLRLYYVYFVSQIFWASVWHGRGSQVASIPSLSSCYWRFPGYHQKEQG